MNKIFIVLMMMFCHIVDDYYLQGWLASAKQKKYWEENAPDEMYKHDYIWALIMHSFSWSFMIMLPLMFIGVTPNIVFYTTFVANVAIHAIVDDLKANKFQINLITDQTVHLLQIATTAIILL